MAENKQFDLLLHPVRLRIIMVLERGEHTAQQIAAMLHDVPTSSVYRHLQVLQEADMVEVVAERQVRGAVEKTLRLARGVGSIEPDDAARMTADAVRRALLAFQAQLFHEFDHYLQREDSDPGRDLIGFRAAICYATDEEWLQAMAAINAALAPLLDHGPGAGRIRRRLATLTLPLPETGEQ